MKTPASYPNKNVRFPHYGEIWDINFEPAIGSEIGKTRPALVVSNDINNQFADIVTVLPLTSQPASRRYPFEVVIPGNIGGLTTESRIKANQIRSLDKQRLFRFRGTLPEQYIVQVKEAIRIHLNMK